MKPINIILIVINLFCVVICGTGFAIMLAKGKYIFAAINFIAVVINVILTIMFIREELSKHYENWIEKQGEKLNEWKEGDIVRHGGILALVIKGRRAMKQNGEQIIILYPNKWVKANSKERKYFFEEFEKQDKQEKPQVYETEDGEIITYSETDGYKVAKPKFHENEWIIQENIGVYKVIEVCETWYEVADNKDNHYSIGFDKEYMCRPWTINDAKDGDILVDKYNNIGIFQECKSVYFQECKGVYWYSYIYLGCDGELRGFGIGGMHEQTDTHPATKEQRDLLFKKMHDAGYEWDVEKKN